MMEQRLVKPPYCKKSFAQCCAMLASTGWRVRVHSCLDEEIPDAPLVALHPCSSLKVAIYALEDIQLLAQSITTQSPAL